MTAPTRRARAIACTAFALSALAAAVAPAFAEIVNRVVLRVNDRIVTLYDFERQLARARNDILAQEGVDPQQQRSQLENAPREVMRSIFDELLILTRADQLGLSVSELEIDQELERQMGRFGMTDEQQMRAALAENGLTLEQFRLNLRNQMLWREVTQQELYPRIDVDDQELRAIYREHSAEFAVPGQRRLREIVVLEEGGLSADAREGLAAELRVTWTAGGDPEALVAAAREKHGEESVALLDVGWVGPGDLSAELEKVAWELPAGDVSGIVEARGGLHLLQVLEVKEESQRPFEEVRDALLGRERSKRFEAELEGYLGELEDKAYWSYQPVGGIEDFQTASGRTVREGQRDLLAPAPAEPIAEPIEEPADEPGATPP